MSAKNVFNRQYKEDATLFTYTAIEPQLDELYAQKQTYLMKMMFNQSNMGSALRFKKHPEPDLLASHQDFLLEEMQDMAIDF
jgi:hypothetical protein